MPKKIASAENNETQHHISMGIKERYKSAAVEARAHISIIIVRISHIADISARSIFCFIYYRSFHFNVRFFMLSYINEFIWSYIVLGLMLFTGIMFTFGTGIYQLRRALHIFKSTLGNRSCLNKGSGEMSPFQAFTTSLAASMGTGNIVGVAVALAIGGPGAIFWMWISAFLGMMTAYAENNLAAKYSRHGSGSLGYIYHASGSKIITSAFALFCVLGSFGMGNMAQSNSSAAALYAGCGIDARVSGIVIMILCGTVIFGGVKRIGEVTEKLIPILSLIYFIAAAAVIFLNHHALPAVFSTILRGAFGIDAATGGVCGAMLKSALNEGLRRGAFSNEAGLGSMPMLNAHSGCKGDERGCWAILEVFADTIIFCTLTALVILVTDSYKEGSGGAGTIIDAFESSLPNGAGALVSICIALYGFATLMGWCCCGESCFSFLTKGKGIAIYRILFITLAGAGALFRAEMVWTASDIFNGLMAIPNLVCLIILSREVIKGVRKKRR